jgi:hypothetical protein|tara:strand:- start:2920 stop:3324 length:405 start_codon:yes stop_codon:yes gene_type:complete
MKSLLFEVLDRATKNNMEFLICDSQDGTIFMSQRKKATEKDIKKMYDTWDIWECSILFPSNNSKLKKMENNDYNPDNDIEVIDADELIFFEGKYLIWNEGAEKENRVSDGSSSLWDILGLDKLHDEWSNFYKYL